jgi:hypothetical protein
MGHLGKKVDSLSTRERCFPNMEDLADSEMESKRERSMAKRAKMKRLISGAIGNELKGIRDLVQQNKEKSDSTASMLDSLSHIVKDLRHRARKVLSQNELDFAEGPRTRKPNPKTKTVARARKLMSRLPEDLQDDVKNVVRLHKSASENTMDLSTTKAYTPNRRTRLARHGQKLLSQPMHAAAVPEESMFGGNNSFLELPRLTMSRMNEQGFGTSRYVNTPSVYGRLTNEGKFTGVYKERFKDFQRDYFDEHRTVSRPSFTRMHNNRMLYKKEQNTSRGKFKAILRPTPDRYPNCTF